MSRFRDVVQAIRAPLEFASEHPERLDRIADTRPVLLAALDRVPSLQVPPPAKARFEEARRLVAAGGLDGDVLSELRSVLAAVLDEDYPLKVLRQTVERIAGVGPKTAAALARKEIYCVEDLLFFLPRSYEDRRELSRVQDLQVGHSVCFEARVTRAGVVSLPNGRRFLQVVVTDGTAAVNLKWFRGVAHFQDRLKPGVRVLVAGDVRRYRYSKELHHPDVELLSEEVAVGTLPRIVPTYSAVEGVPPRSLRRIVVAAVAYASDLVDTHLPEQAAQNLGLPDVGESIRQVHEPGTHLDPEQLRARATPYHLRLVAEELFTLQVGLALRRATLAQLVTQPLAVRDPAITQALASLPFELTGDQKRAWQEISADLGRPRPMNRLLAGDVGTGKTVLAVLCGVAAHASGVLTAVLAPTEILADQHYQTFQQLAGSLGLRVALLTGSTPQAERRSIQRLVQRGELAFLVGTHALLGEWLQLPRLRMVVIDEQHRFGVEQRRSLGQKGEHPHVLVMSATPIPRTLALTVFGDLDHSVLRERPPGRAPVRTVVVPRGSGRRVLGELRRTLARGEQAYVVYPLVAESEKQDLHDATRAYERLRELLPEYRLALLHGRLDAGERSRVMTEFAAGGVAALVSTTVIEVGIDVPNATLLVVQHADRFGLAQLHQLRGRVGRARKPGTAILIADPKGEDASQRLAILEGSADGFDIAEQDLRIRGAGEWLGTRQAGHLPMLKLADLVRHGELLADMREAAQRLSAHDPGLRRHARLRAAVERRWGRGLEFGDTA